MHPPSILMIKAARAAVREAILMNRYLSAATAAAALFALAPGAASACACGCGIFDVGAGTFMPNNANSGLELWFRIAELDQNQNWAGSSKAPASDNSDKQIRTTFYFVGGQYVVNRQWTVMAELPVYDRTFRSTDDGTVFGAEGSLYKAHDFAAGDLTLMATYTGLAKDMSTGIGFGVKLPTGDDKGPAGPLGGREFDRDTVPGTGSTDLIVSGYHVGALNRTGSFGYFVDGRYQFAVATEGGYRPGNELDTALGVSYDLGNWGPLSRIAPVLQLVNSYRLHDTGANADPLNSGYERVLIDPGLSVRIRKLRLNADVALPVYQHVNAAASPAVEGTSGQLVTKASFRFQATYDF